MTEPTTVRIEVDIQDALAELGLPNDAVLTPTAVWFSGLGTRDIAVEFEVAVAESTSSTTEGDSG